MDRAREPPPTRSESAKSAGAPLQLTAVALDLDDVRLAADAGADWITFAQRSLCRDRRLRDADPWIRDCDRAIAAAHRGGRRIAIALSARYGTCDLERVAATAARLADAGADALVASDPGTLEIIRRARPGATLHVSAQAGATNGDALRLFASAFGVHRVGVSAALPEARLRQLAAASPTELELFGAGSHGPMLEGQCALSAWISDASVGRDGACAPARLVREHPSWRDVIIRLNGILVDARAAHARPGLPTVCRGRFRVRGRVGRPFAAPAPASLLAELPRLVSARPVAFRVVPSAGDRERHRHRLRIWRLAIDACLRDPGGYAPRPEWEAELAKADAFLPCTAATTGLA